MTPPSRSRLFAITMGALVLAVFTTANAHLVRVSLASQPDCVLVVAQEGATPLRAAKPAC